MIIPEEKNNQHEHFASLYDVYNSCEGNPAQIQTPMERVPLPNHPGIPWRARMRIALHLFHVSFDPQGRASICGGWLLASSVESAALGGMALANHIADNLGSGGVHPEELAVGLYNEFQPLEGHDIGQFPGFGVHGKRGSSSISTYFLNP
ncbi:hypothetical protein CICLE_v10029835mg [Citrus x clementina]|uniref:Uncharacterized protein n=1 Tax=Citrus clementina TaxID=85681 RepID=V4UD57_CITCL|nr:hypothetical protein CICLE_v10029835mg [Citrus x clementina]